jgi:hypothetical protein
VIIQEGSVKPPSGLSENVFAPQEGMGIFTPADIEQMANLDITVPREELALHVPEQYRASILAGFPTSLNTSQVAGLRDATSLDSAISLAKSYGVKDEELAKILQGSYLETAYKQQFPVSSSGGTSPVPPSLIALSDAERQRLANLRSQATCPADVQKYEVKKYKVEGWDDSHNWVSVLVEADSEQVAKQRAMDAGYDVKQVKWSPEYGETKPKVSGGTVKVKDGKTGETLEFTKEGWDAWPDKYKTIVKTDGLNAAQKEFSLDYYECADGQFILKTDFYALPTHYADIAATQGFSAMQTAFETENVKLGDGQWIPSKDWESLMANDKTMGTNFAEIGEKQGYDAMVAAIDKANEPYGEFLKKVEAGDIIPVAGGQYITKEEFNKLPSGSQQIVKEQGFEALTKATTIVYEKVIKPKGFSWDPVYKRNLAKWESYPKPIITQEEMNEIPFADKDMYHLSEDSYGRAGLVVLASFMPPAKAVLPEYTTKDITAMDWGVAAAQAPLIILGFAPAAISSSLAARVATVAGSTALSGLIGYGTAKSWAGLTPAQRTMGVGMAALCAIPLITTVARNVKISGPGIPTIEHPKGEVVWKGLSVAGTPIIGKSGGKWILGTRGITLPEARLILDGYKPEMMLETKVFVNRTALEKAGFSRIQIDYLTDTLKSRNLFTGKSSPWLDKNVLLEPTQRLNAAEIDTIMGRLNKLEQAKMGSVKDAYLLYGSPTIKAQLAPDLRGWRPIHDWDISLNMNQAKTETFTSTLLKDLEAKGSGTYRINPKTPTLIEKKVGGTWEHIADIHSMEEVSMDILSSKLDSTGTYSYGRMVAEPAITVKYPGVGELRIMRLSESGVRKADTILRVRQTAEGTAFRPPERGIAQPGVPKDAADFYVTLRTFCGEGIAEEWLESWAKAMGYGKTQLAKVLPRIRESMLEVASHSPSDIIGYEFVPASSAKVASRASPSVVVHIPSSLGASVSPSLGSQISKPIYPYRVSGSPQMQMAISAGVSSLISQMPSKALTSSKMSPSVARSIAAKASPSPSLAVSKGPSPSPKLSVSSIPSVYPSGHPTLSAKPSKAPSSVPSPKPRSIPSPSPSPKPSPYPYPYPRPKPGPKPPPKLVLDNKKYRYVIDEGSIAFAMGKLKRKTGLKPQWYYIPPPWMQETPISLDYPPLGAKNAEETTPDKTIQMIGEPKAKVPKSVSIDLGVVDILISNYGKSIKFTGHGLETKVGKSLNIPTRGMSIPATAPMRVAKFKKRGNGHKRVISSRTVSVG